MAGRWFRFLLAIAVGTLVALYYTWRVNPIQPVNAQLAGLRIDFRTDYVLMAAESFAATRDLAQAGLRLAQLQRGSSEAVVRDAVRFAERETARGNYAPEDLQLLRNLLQAILEGANGQGSGGQGGAAP